MPIDASRIVARHIEERTAVEIVRWRTFPGAAAPRLPPSTWRPPRRKRHAEAASPPATVATEHRPPKAGARLLAVLAFPDTDELEVHLILDGRRTIGRAGLEQRPARRGRSDARRGTGARRAVRTAPAVGA